MSALLLWVKNEIIDNIIIIDSLSSIKYFWINELETRLVIH